MRGALQIGSGSGGASAVQEEAIPRNTAITPGQTRRRRGWRGLRIALVAVVVLVGLVAAAGLGVFLWVKSTILDTLPQDLSAFQTYRPQATVVVQDRLGNDIDSFALEKRIWVPLEELPAHVPEAFIAAEDRRFYQHPGVDLAGVFRAALINLAEGDMSQGGSTLTQQLVKNLLVGKEKSYERKLKEAILAYRLDQELGKDRVLELYLNYVALGSGNFGVEAAARDYFGISARELDPGQAAMLAGLPPAPSRYSPRRSPDVARERRRLVLRSMVEEGTLDATDVDAYLDDPVIIPRGAVDARERSDTAYRTEVRRELRRVLGETGAFADAGLVVQTAMDPAVQDVAVKAIRDAVAAHYARQGIRVPLRHLEPDAAARFEASAHGLIRDEDGELVRPGPGECLEVLVGDKRLDDLRAGPFRLRLAPADRSRVVRDVDPEAQPAQVSRRVRPGDVLDVCTDEDDPRVAHLANRPWAEGAAVVIDHRNGEVLAVAGGTDVGLEGFDRATQARRQPGSSFKPYVYAAALAGGRTQLDIVVDSPISLPAGNGKLWTPKNYGGGYAGSVTLRSALARSLNTVAVRMALEVSPARIAALAGRAGVRTPLRPDLTMALGASEVTPFDQAVGYATIARSGRSIEPTWIRALVDVDGSPIASSGEVFERDGEPRRLPGGPGEQVIDPGVAYETSDMMREVVRGGTARRAWREGLDRAGKTGTTNGFVDAWFVGFTSRHVIAVWIGTDGTRSLGPSETGGRAALPAWMAIAEALEEPVGERRAAPPEVLFVPHEGRMVPVGRGRGARFVPRGLTSSFDGLPAASKTPPPRPRPTPAPTPPPPEPAAIPDPQPALPPGVSSDAGLEESGPGSPEDDTPSSGTSAE